MKIEIKTDIDKKTISKIKLFYKYAGYGFLLVFISGIIYGAMQ